jgi:hypothetical protein
MAKYDISVESGSLVLTLDTNAGQYEPRVITLKQPALKLSLDNIKFFDSGLYKKTLKIENIGEIDSDEPTDINDAFEKILALIPTSEGGGGGTTGTYNDVSIYQDSEALPLVFDADTIHSISITSLTGNLNIEINESPYVVAEGQTINFTATREINQEIQIVSTTGTFTVTVIE